jgi:hypothetical protein
VGKSIRGGAGNGIACVCVPRPRRCLLKLNGVRVRVLVPRPACRIKGEIGECISCLQPHAPSMCECAHVRACMRLCADSWSQPLTLHARSESCSNVIKTVGWPCRKTKTQGGSENEGGMHAAARLWRRRARGAVPPARGAVPEAQSRKAPCSLSVRARAGAGTLPCPFSAAPPSAGVRRERGFSRSGAAPREFAGRALLTVATAGAAGCTPIWHAIRAGATHSPASSLRLCDAGDRPAAGRVTGR